MLFSGGRSATARPAIAKAILAVLVVSVFDHLPVANARPSSAFTMVYLKKFHNPKHALVGTGVASKVPLYPASDVAGRREAFVDTFPIPVTGDPVEPLPHTPTHTLTDTLPDALTGRAGEKEKSKRGNYRYPPPYGRTQLVAPPPSGASAAFATGPSDGAERSRLSSSSSSSHADCWYTYNLGSWSCVPSELLGFAHFQTKDRLGYPREEFRRPLAFFDYARDRPQPSCANVARDRKGTALWYCVDAPVDTETLRAVRENSAFDNAALYLRDHPPSTPQP